jgi:hypothetical protein
MKGRLVAWDLFRILQIISIVHFHVHDAFIAKDREYTPFLDSVLYSFFLDITRLFTTGGLNLVALSLFIMGYRGLKSDKLKVLLPLFFIGVLILNLAYSFVFSKGFYFEWDIYHYLLVTIFIVFLLDVYARAYSGAVFICSFFLCLVPWWSLNLHFNNSILQQIFVGHCGLQTIGIWSLLPWIFWASTFWSLGAMLKDRFEKVFFELDIMSLTVLAVASVLLFAVASFEYFYYAPVGPAFSCFVHRPEFLSLSAHLLALIMFFLISINPKLNNFLKPAFKWTSWFYWNRKLALAYITHICVLTITLYWIKVKAFSGLQFLFFVLMQFFVADLITRLLMFMYRKGASYAKT